MPLKKYSTFGYLILAFIALCMSEVVCAAEVQKRPAPECQLNEWGTGDEVNWSSLQGSVVYVDFWASWCTSCVIAFPSLSALQKEFRDQGLVVLGVNLDEDPAEANRFLNRLPAGFRIVSDSSRSCPKSFLVEGLPTSYLIDRAGNIRYHHLGFRRDQMDQLREEILLLLRESR